MAIPSLELILERLRSELPHLRAEFAVDTLEVFGSTVRNEARIDSDVDLLVTFSTAPSLFRFIELEDRLSEILGQRVDLVMKDGLKPSLGRQVLAEAIAP